MFDLFRRGQPSPKQIQKTVKRLTEPHGEQGPRIEAAERLAGWGTPEAIFGLVKRFTVSSRVITQDIEEKRIVVDMLVGLADASVEPLLRFMKTNHQVDWPVRAPGTDCSSRGTRPTSRRDDRDSRAKRICRARTPREPASRRCGDTFRLKWRGCCGDFWETPMTTSG